MLTRKVQLSQAESCHVMSHDELGDVDESRSHSITTVESINSAIRLQEHEINPNGISR